MLRHSISAVKLVVKAIVIFVLVPGELGVQNPDLNVIFSANLERTEFRLSCTSMEWFRGVMKICDNGTQLQTERSKVWYFQYPQIRGGFQHELNALYYISHSCANGSMVECNWTKDKCITPVDEYCLDCIVDLEACVEDTVNVTC